MNRIVVLILAFVFFSGYSNGQTITGVVFLDTNQNGQKEAMEKGIRDIPVSNGDTIVKTDREGNFSLKVEAGVSVFPILPTGYKFVVANVGNSNFKYISNEVAQAENLVVHFPVCKSVQKSDFRIGAVGDMQVGDQEEINYANQTIISELASRHDLDFSIFLGDLVNDDPSLLPKVEGMLKSVFSPIWTAYGNHDRVSPGERQDKAFNASFGASCYAFNYADVHFIVLNNVWSDGTRKYEGRITDRQLRFVANDLALVPKNKLVVISQHIPMVHTKNKEQLLMMLENQRSVLFLSGHTHQVSRHYLGKNITELVAGASCGNWWVGEKDWQGIPSALMQCGSPRNYFVIDFSKNKYCFSFKGIGLDPNRQMDIWVAGQDSLDNRITGFSEYKKNEVIANIYGAGDSTVVKMKVDENEWILMEKASITAPNVNRLITMNKIGNYPAGFSRKAALRNSLSPHIWVGYIPKTLKGQLVRIQVEAKDELFKASGARVFNSPGAD